ncbi:MAG: hypothetical protein PHF67_05025, partial [Candidatus Nanoarchaeia archaeon]|nr:hypothetical protein [Candidatus Nanoarchaeia archaeon]
HIERRKNNMNQKIIGIIAGIVIALAVIGAFGFVYAQETTNKSDKVIIKGTGFVDANNDGFCDNSQAGNCQYKNQANGFVDADNDGLCDHMQSGNCPMHNPEGGCHCSKGGSMKNKAGGCHALTVPA